MKGHYLYNGGALFLTASTVLILSIISGYSRIGEDRGTFEKRLLSKSDGAYVYASKEDKLREAMELPYKYIFLLMPRDTQNEFYFKRADTSLTTNSDTVTQNDLYGWELHACSYKEKLALEFYQRYGDAITTEETEALMNIQARSKNPDAYWIKEAYITVKDKWDLTFQNGKVSQVVLNSDGVEISADKKTNLRDILPVNPIRFVYVEVPDSVKNASNYNQSIPFLIMEDEQRKANEAYRIYVSKSVATSAAKTARKKNGSPTNNTAPSSATTSKSAKINAFNPSTSSFFSQEFVDIEKSVKGATRLSYLRYWLNDVKVGGIPYVRYDKEVRLTVNIPQQPNTAFEYDYRLSDGSIRAKLFRNGILFISTDFDKLIRSHMENLYETQENMRKSQAQDSVSKF